MNDLLNKFRTSFRRKDNVLFRLIVINVIVYLLMGILSLLLPKEWFREYIQNNIAIPSSFHLFIRKPWTIITYAFAHSMDDILHIVFNMLMLFWFGKLITEYLGYKRLLSLYFLGAVGGGIFFLLAFNLIPYFSQQPAIMVGASAAVYAIVIAAAVLLPNYTFYMLFIGPVKLKYIAIFYLIISMVYSFGSNAGGNLAHLGGAFMGWVFISSLKKGLDLGRPINGIGPIFSGIFKKRSKIKVSYNSGNRMSTGGNRPKTEQEEIDMILDKISASGYESLTKEEKQKLFNASQK